MTPPDGSGKEMGCTDDPEYERPRNVSLGRYFALIFY